MRGRNCQQIGWILTSSNGDVLDLKYAALIIYFFSFKPKCDIGVDDDHYKLVRVHSSLHTYISVGECQMSVKSFRTVEPLDYRVAPKCESSDHSLGTCH